MGNSRLYRRAALAAAGCTLTLALAACGAASGSASSPGIAPNSVAAASSATSASSTTTSSSSGPSASGGGSPPGTLTLNWTPPVQNTDGTPVAAGELAGYKILFGESPTLLDQNVAVTDPTVTTYTFQNLPSGTWYFALVSIDSEGNQSAPTNVVSATL
jgi:hypothetical protein